MEKETSCINSIAILNYLKANGIDYAGMIEDLDPEIDGLEDPESFLRNPDNWVSSGVISRLFERATRLLDDDRAAYKMGRYATENADLGFAQRIMVKAFWSVKRGLRHCQQINDQWNKSKKVELMELKRNEATVRLHWAPEMETSKYICQYNQGVYTYLPKIWGGSRVTFKEKCCYFEGAPYCEYHMKWPLKNRLQEIISRFFTTPSVLADTIKEIEKDKKIINQKNDELRAINKELQKIIADHKQAEKELHRYERIVSSSSDHLAMLDRNYVYQMVNDAYLKAQSKSLEEIVGHSVPELFGQEFFEKNQKVNIDRCLAGETVHYQIWVELPSLGERYMHVIHFPYYEEDGSISGYVVNARDITDHKLAEEALASSERKYRNIFENVSDFLYYHDLEGNFIETNFAFKKEYGIEEDTLTFLNLRDMISERYRSEFKDYMRRIKEHGKDTGIFRVKTKNGRELLIEYRNSLVYDSEGIAIGVQGSGRDITERIKSNIEKVKMKQQLLQSQKMESIGTLAGGIAHDFNNLLMGIQGRTSLMLNDIESSSHPHLEHLESIEHYIESATNLTRQLLGFARGGKYEIMTTNLNKLVAKSADLFGRTKKEVSIYRKIQEGIWAVDVDQSQIEQVLLNLYVNAWQSMPGGGELYLETENTLLGADDVKPYFLAPGKYVRISVADTGVGISKAAQKRIFDPFFTTKEMGRGTGLGLASAYGIVKNHNGIINVFSKKGEGTTFNIYLPASEKEIAGEPDIEKEIIRGDATVLLVDDEKMILDVAGKLLNKLGYRVYTAENGKEAIEIFENGKDEIDLVILDMVMPDMGGGEVFDRLKAIDSNVKVLLSSGYSIDGQATNILNRGCRGFVQKPFSMAEFSKKIHDVLDK